MLGKAKTRLSKDIGNQKALDIYQELLRYTDKVAQQTSADLFVFFTDSISQEAQQIFPTSTDYFLQQGKDLGYRMQHAFQQVFEKGYEQILLLGTDCFELTTQHIQHAFDILKEKQVVLGPANDGGYYLIGFKKDIQSTILKNQPWSQSHLYKETIATLIHQGITFGTTEQLSDVDYLQDVPATIRKIYNI